MIENESREVAFAVSSTKRPRLFSVLKDYAAGMVEGHLEHTQDNRSRHVEWRWRSKWLRQVGDIHYYLIKVALIAAYMDPHHCINNGDLLYYTEASPRQNTLRVAEISKPQVISPGQVPPISVPYRVKAFERKRIAIAFYSSVVSELNLPIEHFDNYWERVS